jgi:hypothetical protein
MLITGMVGESRVVIREAADASAPVAGSRVRVDAEVAKRHRFSSLTQRRIDV